MEKIEHIGIAVQALTESMPRFEALLQTPCYKTETVEEQGVTTAFFQVGQSKIELLEATRPDSPIAKFLQKRGEGIHHIAFAVSDIKAQMKTLEAAGFQLLSQEPQQGADGKWVCFLHPKQTHGVLIELCQDRPTTDHST
ncbi:MAG: methylmalonyl-CoA epimerase [Bernardetiaceae bacterium]